MSLFTTLWKLIYFFIFIFGQSLATKSIVALGYKLTQYLFIGGEF